MAEEELQAKEPVPEPESDVKHSEEDNSPGQEVVPSPVKPHDDEGPPAPPPKPKRPQSPFSEACLTLKEAFPDADDNMIRALIVASNGQMENAFNGMLAFSDPSLKPDFSAAHHPRGGGPAPPPMSGGGGGRHKSQIEQDEALARKLAQQYEHGSSDRSSFSSSRRVRGSGYSGRYDDTRPSEPERSFFDDDLPEIKENLSRGFQETRTKVSNWVTTMRKRFDQEDDKPNRPSGYGYENARRTNYYDRDPAEMTDDFQGISLRDEDQPRRHSRETLPKGPPPPKPPRPVMNAFGDEGNKWEPLKSVNPEPIDKDPFFIGESDEEDGGDEEESAKADAKPTVAKED